MGSVWRVPAKELLAIVNYRRALPPISDCKNLFWTRVDLAHPAFVADCLASEPYQHKILLDAGGTTIKHIYITRIVKMPIAMPPLKEQARIDEYASGMSAGFRSMAATLTKTIDRLREYRAALITAAVTGQLDLRKHEQQMEVLA